MQYLDTILLVTWSMIEHTRTKFILRQESPQDKDGVNLRMWISLRKFLGDEKQSKKEKKNVSIRWHQTKEANNTKL